MAQYESRIHIRVKSLDVWKRFKDNDDAGFVDLEKQTELSYVCDCCFYENELYATVEALSKVLGRDGIILADTTNSNVDPYNYCCYYFYDIVKDTCFDWNNNKCEMFIHTSIDDICEWLNYGEFSLSKEEKDILLEYGIVTIGKHFEEINNDIKLPDKIYLRETSFSNRDKLIENILLNDKVELSLAKSNYDSTRLEVKNNFGSLGYLPSDISDVITPLMFAKVYTFNAYVCEVVPLSKRNKHAKSSIIAIHIDVLTKDSSLEDEEII